LASHTSTESQPSARATRGKGALEGVLSRLRARKANALIPHGLRGGTILDIGCGQYPHFLANTKFRGKVGMDQTLPSGRPEGIHYVVANAGTAARLPFKTSTFDVVTMLAVLEHLHPENLTDLIEEVYRVLTPGGVLIITTPPPRTDRILKLLAKLSVVSSEEIDEHQKTFRARDLRSEISRTHFAPDHIHVGHFELGMNIYLRAAKST
jgi:SAM-dependent methyltransferase